MSELMSTEDFHAKIDKIPGDDGWWKNSTGDVYRDAATELVVKGFTQNEALELLEELFHAAAGEYGD